jgi:hypothetical protein
MIPPASQWRWHASAFLFYAAVSIVFLDHFALIRGRIMGAGADPLQFVWFFAWFPWAIAHHINPFYCPLIWQPLGVPLLWVTSVPLLALLAAPVTLLAGPELAYNLVLLATPVLAAWGCYLLCLRITKDFAAACIGGFVFGFSGYEAAANLATINLSFVMLLPLLVLLALHRLDGEITRLRCVLLASVMMVAQFFISIEIFATAAFFGAVTWAAAYRVFSHRRAALLALLMDAVIGAAVTLAALAPFLLLMAGDAHFVKLPAQWPYIFTADGLNFFIPTRQTWLGSEAGAAISRHFVGGLQEQDAYLGLPLLLIIALFAWRSRRGRAGGFLLILFFVFVLASLGPCLRIEGHFTRVILPWLLFLHVPLLASALPGRFALYVSLVAAVIAAIWVAQRGRRYARLGLGVLACIVLLPAPHQSVPIPHSQFFMPGRLQAALGPRSRILVLPFGGQGASTYWQAENRFGYAQTGGYLGYPPAAMQDFPVVEQLFDNFELPGFAAELQNFCAATGTQYIVAGPGTPEALSGVLAQLGFSARRIDDVTVYIVPPHGMFHG